MAKDTLTELLLLPFLKLAEMLSRSAQQRAERRRHGLCVDCGDPADDIDEHGTCGSCAAADRHW